MKNIVHSEDVPAVDLARGKFGSRRRRLSVAAGGSKLGCSLFEIPPGKRAFPFHYHVVNEEAFYVLEGTGRLRFGAEEHEVVAGDYVCFPPGPECAHQLRNDGPGTLKILAMSTMSAPEIAYYPDSKKIGILGERSPDGTLNVRLVRDEPSLGYYDGEEGE